MLFEGNITTSRQVNVPDGREEIRIYSSVDLTVSFYRFQNGDYGPEIAVTAPGDFVGVCGGDMRITANGYVTVI